VLDLTGEAEDAASNTTSGTNTMSDSFVVLPNSVSRTAFESTSDSASGTGLSQRVLALARIFDAASDETQADHPMCLECAGHLRDEINKRALETEHECEVHRRCLEELESERGGFGGRGDTDTTGRAESTSESNDSLSAEELELDDETKKLQLELRKLNDDLVALDEESKQLDQKEAQYFDSFNAFKLNLKQHVDTRDSVVNQVEQVSRQLERLNRVNVCNDAFHVWFDGSFGTVNGFRLGRLPNIPVEWDEINAAWGMSCLLLHTMAQSVGLQFKNGYTLKPLGSFSKVTDSKGASFELYGPVNILSSHRYDRAMTGFLHCLKEFEEFARGVDQSNDRSNNGSNLSSSNYFKLPYQIDGDKIDGRKIGFPFNRYERWTAALKIMLVDLKTCLAWVAQQG